MQARVFVGTGMLVMGLGLAHFGANAAPPAQLQDWPRIESAVKRDEALEARIATILKGMTLAEKVGQMTQPEIKSITPEDVQRYHIGSVLNGGGSRLDQRSS